ncbi:SAMP-activating enzyme E1 [Flavobacteriaceae bacterium UJ101]|nr:SAMP-activating enzyme E1 [Flavobacteriaceae bacterium UJ101]
MDKERYSRHIKLSEIGIEGQQKLLEAKVLVIGAGGLGCPVLQYLVAAGVGTVGIIDDDVVEKSNLQRQILFGVSDIGKNKARAVKNRLNNLNPDVQIEAIPERLSSKNALKLFEDYDIIVDGTDNFSTRYMVNDACILANKPLVSGAIYKFEGQVAVLNYKGSASYRCLFPKLPKQDLIPSCNEIGVLGVLPGIIGTLQANEVLKMILGLENILKGQLLVYSALKNEMNVFHIARNESEIQQVKEKKDFFETTDYEVLCGVKDESVEEITVDEFLNNIDKKLVQIIDVREKEELELDPIALDFSIQHIPLGKIQDSLELVDKEKKKIIFCQKGMRSLKAVKILKEHKIDHSVSLKGGASELFKMIIEKV